MRLHELDLLLEWPPSSTVLSIDLEPFELEKGCWLLIALQLGLHEQQVADPMIHAVRFEHLTDYSSHRCSPSLVTRPDRCWKVLDMRTYRMDWLEHSAFGHSDYLAKTVTMLHQDSHSLRPTELHYCWCPKASQHLVVQLWLQMAVPKGNTPDL